MLFRRASRLMNSVATPSKKTWPVVGIMRNKAKLNEDFPAPVRPTEKVLLK